MGKKYYDNLEQKSYYCKKHFIYFLKQNNAYEKYIYNFEQEDARKFRRWSTAHTDSKSFFKICNISDYVNKAFHWDCTQQGYDFWLDLHMIWEKNVRNLLYSYYEKI